MSALRTLLAGRWQIPAGIVAITIAAIALVKVKPPPRVVDFDAVLADVHALKAGHRYHDAANAAANLLAMQPPLPVEHQATLHHLLSKLLHEIESLRETPIAENATKLLEHRAEYVRLGGVEDADDELRAAHAHQWLGQTTEAVYRYEQVLTHNPPGEVRHAALRALVQLLERDPRRQDRRRELLEALLGEESVSPAFAWWTLQHAMQEALDSGDFARARELLPRYGRRFERSDLRGYYDYISAWIDVREGLFEEAAPLIERIDSWLADHTVDDAELHKAGFLPAMNRWLRGRVELGQWQPQAALASFEHALRLDSTGVALVRATMGRGEALALLARHETARKCIRDMLRLRRGARDGTAEVARARATVVELMRDRHDAGDPSEAIQYNELALEMTSASEHAERLELLDRLGREHEDAAGLVVDDVERAQHDAAAAQAFEEAANLAQSDATRLASLLWTSGQNYDRAGRPVDARRILERFVETFRADARTPRAYLHLGQACAAAGQPDDAIRWFQTLVQRHPQLEEAARARLAIADALLVKGAGSHAEAERVLLELLEDDRLAPAAAVFRDALAALCDLLFDQGRYGETIARVEDFLGFYPNDSERHTFRFTLADAYRRSALALRDDPPAGIELDKVAAEVRDRLRQAAALFGELARATGEGADADESWTLYQRLALFYQADCLFELNQPETLDEALAAYRLASARYQGEPAALTAQVQIANILLRQGKLTDAARAVERARWLLRSTSDVSLAQSGSGMTRTEWTRFLDAVASSHLLRDVFSATQ